MLAQGLTTTGNLLLGGVIALLIILLIVVFTLVDGLMAMHTKAAGVNVSRQPVNIIPGLGELTGNKTPDYVDEDSDVIQVKRGFDIKLLGEPAPVVTDAPITKVAVCPPDFIGIAPIPKMEVEIGAKVKAGEPLFYDKTNPGIKFCSPVSGTLSAINRGEKRSIAEVVIDADSEIDYKVFEVPDLESSGRNELVDFMIGSGLWPLIKQRPFDVIPEIDETPRDIFISTFDSAPLAPDTNILINGKGAEFQKGLDVLAKLTDGKVYLGLNASKNDPPSDIFTAAQGVEKMWFKGKHPAGNVGTQIHLIKPINKGDVVWTLDIQAVCTIGSMWLNKVFDMTRVVALTGDELGSPAYVRTVAGAAIKPLIENQLQNDHIRVISGDVLSGKAVGIDGYLGIFDDQVTVIEEGDQYEMFGWILPLEPRPSISRTFPNFLFPDKKFKVTTNTHGEQRAFVVTGQYESVSPFDIYIQHLMKAILIKDIERMEGLGIYELSPEDVALPEFVCTSKQSLQEILREGQDYMREQG